MMVSGNGKLLAAVAVVLAGIGVGVAFALQKPTLTGTSLTIVATDSLDPGPRSWYIFVDKPPGAYVGNGQYANAPSFTNALVPSGTIWTVDISSLTPGLHTMYFIVTQSGGAALGTYSGTITAGAQTAMFAGVDVNNSFQFAVVR